MTNLRRALADYLELRRAMGFKLTHYGLWLGDFLDFVEKAKSPVVTTALAVAWAIRPQSTTAHYRARRLGFARGFMRYLSTLDPSTEVPPPDLLPSAFKKRPPYLYSETQVRSLMDAAKQLNPSLRARTYETVIGLLAVSGMRIGEVIALDRDDVDLGIAVLTVRSGKFGKSREIALHGTTSEAMAQYARERDGIFASSGIGPFFVSLRNRRLLYQDVRMTFARLADRAGLSQPLRPRIHDLRHAFAFWTLRDWQEAGIGLEERLPQLSTYLGHVSPSTTYWYFTSAPELLGAVANRLEQHMGDLP